MTGSQKSKSKVNINEDNNTRKANDKGKGASQVASRCSAYHLQLLITGRPYKKTIQLLAVELLLLSLATNKLPKTNQEDQRLGKDELGWLARRRPGWLIHSFRDPGHHPHGCPDQFCWLLSLKLCEDKKFFQCRLCQIQIGVKGAAHQTYDGAFIQRRSEEGSEGKKKFLCLL